MAERRMFSKTIIDSDTFLDMPLSTQALYFHLSMRADDEGFVNNPKKIARMIGASEDDAKLLITKQFLIPFESGVVVIRHWKIHNYIRGDRKHETQYLDERSMLEVKNNGMYDIATDTCQTHGSQLADNLDTEVRLGKDSLDKDSIFIPSNKFDEVPVKANAKQFESEFETLWEKYPRKQGKKDALRHFVAARKRGVDYKTISDGLDKYIAYIDSEGIGSQYVKHGSAWFCQEAWNDDYTSQKELAKKKQDDWIQRWLEKDD